MSLETGRPLRQLGKYDIIEKIAEGGMGAVYKGRSLATGEVVAIKVLPPETAKNPLLLKRFEQEFRAASLIDHPNVVRAIDYWGTGPTPFLVMEFVDGESLGQRVERDGPLEEADAIRLIGQVCEGLRRAHKQGLIHRDVKPDNIMVTQDGLIAKLTDLGLVKDLEGELNLTRTGRGLGTPHFMAPEQFRNAKGVDERCDIYSLGATLYTLVTGEIPFDKTNPLDCWLKKTKNDFPKPADFRRNISQRTNWAICRAMSADPAARPASCREFMEDLLGSDWRGQQNSDSMRMQEVQPQIEDVWYLVYRDEQNQPRTVKGSTESIRRNLQNNALGDVNVILVSRSKTGQFLPLKNVPEFRDVVVGSHETQINSSSKTPTPSKLVNTLFSPPKPNSSSSKHNAVKPGGGTPTPANTVGSGRAPYPTDKPNERQPSPVEARPVIPGLLISPPDQQPIKQSTTFDPANRFDPLPWILIAIACASLAIGLVLFTR
jgi:eukaryotic-like serine/threonine-protein kinase